MNLTQALFALSTARGPSGVEWVTGGTSVVDTARELLTPLVDETWTDPHGNLIGVKKNPGAPRVLLDAHLDEVCLFVTGQKEGFLTFLGRGTDTRLLPDTAVKVLTPAGEVTGVITCLPPHVLTQAEKDAPFELEDLFIDCGLTEDTARDLIGCPVVYDTEPFLLGEHRLCGKSLDDRTCYAMFLRTLELVQDKDLAVEVCLVGSTQEETTGGGAEAAGYALDPDWAIAADVTFGDSPDCSKEETFPLGGGVTLGWGPHLNRRLAELIRQTATDLELDCTLEILPADTGTNASAFQISREGVPTALLSVPLRYMHTPREVIDLRDIETGARLTAAVLERLGREEA